MKEASTVKKCTLLCDLSLIEDLLRAGRVVGSFYIVTCVTAMPHAFMDAISVFSKNFAQIATLI